MIEHVGVLFYLLGLISLTMLLPAAMTGNIRWLTGIALTGAVSVIISSACLLIPCN